MQETVNSISTLELLGECLEKQLSFAAYRLPGSENITLIVQENGNPEIIETSSIGTNNPGFLFAPFGKEDFPLILIRPDIVLHGEASPSQVSRLSKIPSGVRGPSPKPFPRDTDRHTHIGNVNKAVDAIHARHFEKVVLSRVKTIRGDFLSRADKIFKALADTYPHAFVSLVHFEGQTWIGASPEPLLISDTENYTTVSLAGTRIAHESNLDMGRWGDKERWEQELVSRHIERVLHVHSVAGIRKTGPYIAAAGNVLHLRTDYSFPLASLSGGFAPLVMALHPTPAVCGMDPALANDFIRDTEGHAREYFTGFLGPVGIDGPAQLYVNLRCMRLEQEGIVMFMGGGITRDSVAEDEWHETEIKSETLLSVL